MPILNKAQKISQLLPNLLEKVPVQLVVKALQLLVLMARKMSCYRSDNPTFFQMTAQARKAKVRAEAIKASTRWMQSNSRDGTGAEVTRGLVPTSTRSYIVFSKTVKCRLDISGTNHNDDVM